MSYIPQSPNTYQGNQVIINSDRLIFNAKEDSILLFSDKAIGFSTNGSFHFDTSPDENESKFVVNSPTEPAVLGDQLEDLLNEMLDLIGGMLDDIEYKVGYIVTVPSSPTAPNPANTPVLQRRRSQIQQLKSEIENIKSLNTKLV